MTTPVKKMVLLLAARAGERAAFRERFTVLAGGAGPGERWSLELDGAERVRVPHMDVMRDSPAPQDGVIEFIGAALAGAEPVAARVLAELKPTLDVARSNAVYIDEYMITQGEGPVFCVMTLRRYPTMTRPDYMEAWFGRHSKLGEKVDGVRYRQNHADLAPSAALNERLGLAGPELDGFAVSYFDSPSEALRIMSAPAVAVGAIEDERRFIDHSRSQFGLYRTVVQR